LLALASEARVSAGGWDANVAAVFGNCMIPIAAFLAFDRRGWRRAGLFVVLLVLVASVILSGSRAGLAVLGAVLVLLLLRGRRYRPLAVVCAGIVIAVVTFMPERYWMRFLSVAQLGDIVVDRSLQLRQEALETGLVLFRENWLTGVGLGNFLVESTRFMSTPVMAHNAFVEVAVNLGAFGLLAYVIWLASGVGMVARATRLYRIAHDDSHAEMARVIGLGVLFFCVGALTLSIPFYPILWLLLALANGCRVASERGEP
jgi:O-antigen ligase